jgi:hypothetical protein
MWENLKLAFTNGWHVLLAGLVLGAGIPTVFSLGVRALAMGGAAQEGGRIRPIGKVLATICFGVVVLAIVLGITFIVASGFGKKLDFEHIYPVLVDK